MSRCLTVPLECVPEGDWICPACVMSTEPAANAEIKAPIQPKCHDASDNKPSSGRHHTEECNESANGRPAAAAAATKPGPKPARKRQKVTTVAKGAEVVVDLSRLKAATPTIIQQYTGAVVRIPGSFFRGFDVPAIGYWLATVGAFADGKKTVWLHIPEEPAFWCSADQLAKLTIN